MEIFKIILVSSVAENTVSNGVSLQLLFYIYQEISNYYILQKN